MYWWIKLRISLSAPIDSNIMSRNENPITASTNPTTKAKNNRALSRGTSSLFSSPINLDITDDMAMPNPIITEKTNIVTGNVKDMAARCCVLKRIYVRIYQLETVNGSYTPNHGNGHAHQMPLDAAVLNLFYLRSYLKHVFCFCQVSRSSQRGVKVQLLFKIYLLDM